MQAFQRVHPMTNDHVRSDCVMAKPCSVTVVECAWCTEIDGYLGLSFRGERGVVDYSRSSFRPVRPSLLIISVAEDLLLIVHSIGSRSDRLALSLHVGAYFLLCVPFSH